MRDDLPAPEHTAGFVVKHASTIRVPTTSEHGAEYAQRGKWGVWPRAARVNGVELTIAVRAMVLFHTRFYHACPGQKSESRPAGATRGFVGLPRKDLDLVGRLTQALHEQCGRTGYGLARQVELVVSRGCMLHDTGHSASW